MELGLKELGKGWKKEKRGYMKYVKSTLRKKTGKELLF